LGAPARSVLLLGGGARSRLWARVRADLMGLPMGLSQQTDASPVGGAVLGAVAAGLFPTIEDAARRVAAPAATIEPDPRNRGAIEAAYRRYLRLFESLKPLYEDAS
jgi:xylulokinase